MGFAERHMLFTFADDYESTMNPKEHRGFLEGFLERQRRKFMFEDEQIPDPVMRDMYLHVHKSLVDLFGVPPLYDTRRIDSLLSAIFCQFSDRVMIDLTGQPSNEDYNRLVGNERRGDYVDYEYRFPNLFETYPSTHRARIMQIAAHEEREETIPLYQIIDNRRGFGCDQRVPNIRHLRGHERAQYALQIAQQLGITLPNQKGIVAKARSRGGISPEVQGRIDEAVREFTGGTASLLSEGAALLGKRLLMAYVSGRLRKQGIAREDLAAVFDKDMVLEGAEPAGDAVKRLTHEAPAPGTEALAPRDRVAEIRARGAEKPQDHATREGDISPGGRG